MKENKPNIILINCDDLGYGDLGAYGSKINKTPAIDRLASEGVKFTSFYMASSVCSPSRGAMLTGCYPKRTGFDKFEKNENQVLFPGDSVGLNPEEVTIANILKDVGYKTKIVGKWHCGDQPEFLPTNFGFESYYGLPYSNDMGRSYIGDEDKKWIDLFSTYPPLPLMDGDEVIEEQPDQATLTERYVEQSIRFIRENRDKPFFLYLAHMHVHLPHNTPRRFMDQSDNGPYGAAVECIDWSTDVIMHELNELEISENTIIIFTSDNGSNTRFNGSNSPLKGGKHTCWEGGFRVPCIMKWPGKLSPGNVYDGITTSMDFMPTLINIADSKIPHDRIIDGKNIGSLLSESSKEISKRVFFYYELGGLCAIRRGKWKYFPESPNYGEALYDLDEDISESKNLLKEHPEKIPELKDLLESCRQDIGDDLTGVRGRNCRPIGKVNNPRTLTTYDCAHPYMIAMYDLSDRNWG